MKRVILLVCVLFFVYVCASANAQSPSAINQKPESRKTVDGGIYRYHHGISSSQEKEIKAKIREFIWLHWIEQRRAKVGFRTFSVEGDPTTVTFFVDRDKDGKWFVVLKVEEKCCWPVRLEKETSKKVFRNVARVELITDASSPEIPKPVSENDLRSGSSYAIRLDSESRNSDFLY